MDVLSEVGSTLGYFCALGTVQCAKTPGVVLFSFKLTVGVGGVKIICNL